MGNKQPNSASNNRNSTLVQRNNHSLYTKVPQTTLNRERPKINRRCSELRVSPNLSNGGTLTPTTPSGTSSFDAASTSELRTNGSSSDFNRQSRRRWSSAAVVSKGASRPKRLLAKQCHILIKSWNKKIPKNRVAKDIFCSIFTEVEELKPLFGISENVKGKKLRSDPKFVAHANLFADTLDFVIRNLDDISMVNENAEQLGR